MSTKYYKISDGFFDVIKPNFKEVEVLLDIGCGIRPFNYINAKVHVCIEPHKEYIENVQILPTSEAHFVFLNTDALSGIKNFADKSVDTVCMMDLIEHLEKEDGFELLKEANRVARKQIIVFTPLGYFPQHYVEGENDAWGLHGGALQQHKSGWELEDFGEDWNFYICEAFAKKEDSHVPLDRDFDAFFAIKNIS